ncbi:MAG: elongation factor G [Phycisphaerales bacterium]|jgi:elongation factor G|nr:elongation factor G [Phycisphaerales bacterium]
MAVRNPADIRNIALTGSGGCGKTTLSERLLLATGVIQRMGTVQEGNTVSDWSQEEKHHQHSIRPSLLHVEYEGHWINLLDTPGRADFLGHAIACFPAVETVAVVIDAAKGIETATRRLMQVAKDRNLPRVIIINKIDEPNLDLPGLVESIREAFGPECLPIDLPAKNASEVEDVFDRHPEAPDPDFSSKDEAHTQILEQIVEMDDSLTEKYFDTGEEGLDQGKIHDALEKALDTHHLVPICFVSAKTGAGIAELLHVFASLLPSPLEGNPRTFVNVDDDGKITGEVAPEPAEGKPLIAHVFNVVSDPFVGKVGLFKVHQGVLKAKGEVHINATKKGVRVGHILRRQGKDNQEVEAIGPGDIGAVAKIDEVAFDAVLHDGSQGSLHLKPLPLPRPMFGLAVELKNHADETKFSTAVQKLTAEDPCFVVERIAATKQTVMRGLGELHLRIITERLKDEYKIEILTETPKVAYKETVTSRADGHHRHKKQTGGAGQFGEVYLSVEPLPHEENPEGFEFVNDTVGGSIPKQFMPAIEKGVRSVLSDGAIAGYPMLGIRVRITDGKHHAVDSKEVAFVTAGKRAFIDAVRKARPVLLEPFVHLEITAPADKMGDISGDLSTKRGRVQDTEMLGQNIVVIKAIAPASELQNYANELKSITGGAGSFSMDYSHDEPTPPHVQQAVISAFQPHEEED